MLSVVVPLYNESATIPELFGRLSGVCDGLAERYELIFVNDGSQDDSMLKLRALSAQHPQVKALDLSRNFGLQAAYSAGLARAAGDLIVLMDGDLQDPPEAIPQLLAKHREGYDVVYAIKAKRKEGFVRRAAFSGFYGILGRLAAVPMPAHAGGFSVMSRRVVDVLNQLPERNRLVSGIRAWVGFSQTGVVIERGKRFSGKPRQTLRRLWRMALDGIFAFSAVPVRIATSIGLTISIGAVVGIVAVVVFRMLSGKVPIGWASLMCAVMFFGGMQLVFIGVLGEYVSRIFDEVRGRPLYLVKETVGFDRTA